MDCVRIKILPRGLRPGVRLRGRIGLSEGYRRECDCKKNYGSIVTSYGFIVVSTQSATVVGFHTVLAILFDLACEAVSVIKMAKLQGPRHK